MKHINGLLKTYNKDAKTILESFNFKCYGFNSWKSNQKIIWFQVPYRHFSVLGLGTNQMDVISVNNKMFG